MLYSGVPVKPALAWIARAQLVPTDRKYRLEPRAGPLISFVPLAGLPLCTTRVSQFIQAS